MYLGITEFQKLLIDKEPHIYVSAHKIRKDCENGVLIGAYKLSGTLWIIPIENAKTYMPKIAKKCVYDKRILGYRKPCKGDII